MAPRSLGALTVLLLRGQACRQKPEKEVSEQRAVLSASVTMCSESRKTCWQSPSARRGWVKPPCCSPPARLSCRSHTQTHTHCNEGTRSLSTETQQGHFQFNGPCHLWIYCLSAAAESAPTPLPPILLPCLVRFLNRSNVQRDRTAKGVAERCLAPIYDASNRRA